jgi:hypothetical protein
VTGITARERFLCHYMASRCRCDYAVSFLRIKQGKKIPPSRLNRDSFDPRIINSASVRRVRPEILQDWFLEARRHNSEIVSRVTVLDDGGKRSASRNRIRPVVSQ